jgi:hypothetical protein
VTPPWVRNSPRTTMSTSCRSREVYDYHPYSRRRPGTGPRALGVVLDSLPSREIGVFTDTSGLGTPGLMLHRPEGHDERVMDGAAMMATDLAVSDGR